MIDSHGVFLLAAAASSIVILVLLIAVGKLNPFLTLVVVSLALGLVAGMPAALLVHSFEAGMGATLGHIAIVIALGTMLGKMLAESGGADQIAFTLVRVFGERRIHWAMLLIGLIVGLPTFFEVGFVLLVPIAYTVAKRTGRSLLFIGLPMAAGLSADHGLVPPHPAAMLAVAAYQADVGRTIFLALLVGIPAAILAGPLFGTFMQNRITLSLDNPIAAQFSEGAETRKLPSFGVTLFTILLPVVLMLLASAVTVRGGSAIASTGFRAHAIDVLRFAGNDDVALLIGVLVSLFTLGTLRGFGRDTLLRFTSECVAPTAGILLLVGAGGGFGRVLMDSGVGRALLTAVMGRHIPLLLFAWTLAALLRLATGSATVAMTTAAGIVAPISLHSGSANPSLLALATGAGSLIFSHVNDGGFWMVKEYFQMSVVETLQSWSVMETILSVTGLFLTLLLAQVIH